VSVESRLERQVAFLLELDKAKHVLRRNHLVDGSRLENDAEHMWHLAVMAIVLEEYATEPVDLGRVLRMVLLHDVVEIDAGDTFVYDDNARIAAQEGERSAAERIFGLLPVDQAIELRALWREFEASATPDSRFAAALDRLHSVLLIHANEGRTWADHGVTGGQVLGRNASIGSGAPALWALAQRLIADAVARGYLPSR
jgi:putative hydrolase of HD superfamily